MTDSEGPTVVQIKAAQNCVREIGDGAKAMHYMPSGMLIIEYRWGEFEAVQPDGTVLQDVCI